METSPIVRAPSRAAEYVRMSTEHQQYSPQNQADVIRQYAADHNMDIVQVYSDHGRSGLNIAGRDGLNQLMSDVEAKRTDFTSLLVYDVSRWGRFQDVDVLSNGGYGSIGLDARKICRNRFTLQHLRVGSQARELCSRASAAARTPKLQAERSAAHAGIRASAAQRATAAARKLSIRTAYCARTLWIGWTWEQYAVSPRTKKGKRCESGIRRICA